MKDNVILGQVDFINCLPINLAFGEIAKENNIKIINAIPSKLNTMILNNEIDIAPVSSVTYLENKDKLTPIANLCISSNGPADSVLLFSDYPLNELNGSKIALSHASATSNKLLQIILKEFLNFNCKFKIENATLAELYSKYSTSLSRYSAVLLIGDQALIEYSKKQTNKYIYDLGALWKKYTGLPMVFALWVARKDFYLKYPNEISNISTLLKKSKEKGLNEMFNLVLKKSQEKLLMNESFYKDYFEHLNFDFNEDAKKGLNEFEKYCMNLHTLVKT